MPPNTACNRQETVAEREELLLRTARVIEARKAEIRDALIDECGSACNKALWEIDYVLGLLRSAAGGVRHMFGETMPFSENASQDSLKYF